VYMSPLVRSYEREKRGVRDFDLLAVSVANLTPENYSLVCKLPALNLCSVYISHGASPKKTPLNTLSAISKVQVASAYLAPEVLSHCD
jgi:hypothetical protein